MTNEQRLLSYLNPYGVGSYQSINPILKEIFPFQNDDSDDHSFIAYQRQVKDFLNDLESHNLIKFQGSKFGDFGVRMFGKNYTLDSADIKASITPDGSDRISKQEQKEKIYQFSLSFEDIFLRTLNDIREKLDGDIYDAIRACGLLRQLLTDSPALADRANHNYRHKFQFHVSDYLSKPPIKPYIHFSSVEPNTIKTLIVDKPTFLKINILTFDNHEYTVLEIIRGASHFMGGIHSGNPANEKDQILADFDQIIKQLIQIQPSITYNVIQSISKVTLKALEPLELMIKANASKGVF